ncbi:MAG: hypothetical protein WKG01_04775 [Kofleriaceae bacterium]
MRAILFLLATAATAAADVRVGAAVGAGGQGDASYGALEARLDAETPWFRLGLGARAVWLDGDLREDFARPVDAIRIVRLFELAAWDGQLALAAGGLAPAQLAHVADGHRAALDDRPRTGVRAALTGESLSLALELDDVLDPALAGGVLAWVGTRWVARGAAAVDPAFGEAAIELALARRWQRDDARLELGGGGVSEPGFGVAALAFADATIDRGTLRFTGRAELRAGSGSVGAAFGAMHRLERTAIYDHSERGVGGAIAAGIAAPAGWLQASLRARPGNGELLTVSAGAPAGRWLQAGAWFATTEAATAGAAELRVAWARRFASAIEVARMYDTDAMQPAPAWSVTAWFAATSD